MFSIVMTYDRLWDIECGACLRVLEGHEELVRCIRFDNKRIVSGAYDGSVMHTHTPLCALRHMVCCTLHDCLLFLSAVRLRSGISRRRWTPGHPPAHYVCAL